MQRSLHKKQNDYYVKSSIMSSAPFHITLPSDTNRALYPDNRAADYKVQLDRPIALSDKTRWEVAVTDLIVPSNIQSTETEAWFQIQNAKGEVSKKFFVPGLHFYKSTRSFLTTFRSKLHNAIKELSATSFIDNRDLMTMSTNKNPPTIMITTRLRQYGDNESMYNANAFNGLILNQELANLFGLPDSVQLLSDNTYREWRDAENQLWYKDDKDLWVSVSGFSQTDREQDKHYLPNLRSYAYRDKKHVLAELIKAVNNAVRQAKLSGKIGQHDDVTCFVNASGQITFTFITQMNTLPGRDITDITRLNGVTFSPALAYVIGGLTNAWRTQPVRLIARNYYIAYLASGYTEEKFRGDDWVTDRGEYWNLGVHVYGRYSLHLKPGARSQNNPADLTDASTCETKIVFSRTEPFVDLSKKTLKHYVENNLTGKTKPVGHFITKQNDIVIKEDGPDTASVATTEFFLKSEVKVKSGHQKINIYSDIVDPHCVGNEMRSLLRTVSHNRKGKSGDATSLKEINLSVPYYVPVKPGLRELRDIAIRVEDEHNHKMPFAPGKTSLDLHFRPTKRTKLSQFTITLPCGEDVELQREYDISPRWSVCLVDVHFPFGWRHVLDREMKATLSVAGTSTDVHVPPGEYTTQSFLKQLDLEIGKASSNSIELVKESNIKYRNPVEFEINTDPYNKDQENSIQLSDDLAQVLGLFEPATLTDKWRAGTGNQTTPNWQTVTPDTSGRPKDFTVAYTRRGTRGATAGLTTRRSSASGAYRKTKFTFKREVNLNRGFKLFYVYAPDLIESVHIGDVKVPLLRQFIPQTGNKSSGEFIHQEFITPHYKQVKAGLNLIKKVNISITDELGRPVQFTGNVKPTATLHFQHE